MLQLVYHSIMSHRFRKSDIRSILTSAERCNAEQGVTGLLVFDGRRFLQVLEGEAAAVEAIFGAIARDDRHEDVTALWRRNIWLRNFSEWSMAYRDARTADDLTNLTRAMLREADPATAGLFRTFVDARRAA